MKKKQLAEIRKLPRQRTGVIDLDAYARIAFLVSLGLVAVAVIGYVSMTSFTVWNTAKRSSLEKSVASLQASIADLEGKASALSGTITEKLAKSKGFEDKVSVKYISAKPLSKAANTVASVDI